MGSIQMEESSKESVVQMRKSTEISPSLSNSWNPSTKRRRCRPDSSVVCYNLEKSNVLKSFTQGESDCYVIDKDRSSTYFPEKNYLKHAMHEDQEGEIDVICSSGIFRKEMMNLRQGLKAYTFGKTSEVGRHTKNEKEISMWFDVKLTDDGICRAENVPFVRLTSKLDGKQILGYPVEIEEPIVCSEMNKKESASGKLFNDDEGSGFVKLVRKTSRRTPVCYVSTKVYSQDTENGLLSQSKKGSTPSLTCIPVAHIFSKIIAAVGQ